MAEVVKVVEFQIFFLTVIQAEKTADFHQMHHAVRYSCAGWKTGTCIRSSHDARFECSGQDMMRMRRCRQVGLLVLIAGMTGALATAQTDARSHAKRAKTLNDTLETIRLTDGFENIGGASIQDAASMLRDNVAFPVALEMVEFERPKDFVTLDEALAKLHEMQSVGSLGSRDKDRLHKYQEMAKAHQGSEVLVPRQRTFTLVRNRITIRDLLDEIIKLDDEYEWNNSGTDRKPLIVIQPRVLSALNWPVSPVCRPHRIAIEQALAACKGQECGSFTNLLSEHHISVLYMYVGPVSPSKPEPDPSPHGFIDWCSESLAARDVLNRIARSSRMSWTLGGIKGMRFLMFFPVGR